MNDDTTKSQQEDISDEAIATRIRYAVDVLNLILSIAADRGLEVEVDWHDVSVMGGYHNLRIYEANVSRRTNL